MPDAGDPGADLGRGGDPGPDDRHDSEQEHFVRGGAVSDPVRGLGQRLRQELLAVHDVEDAEPELPAGGVHKGEHHQLHGDV